MRAQKASQFLMSTSPLLKFRFHLYLTQKIPITSLIFDIQVSSSGFSLILMCLRNHIQQLRLYDQYVFLFPFLGAKSPLEMATRRERLVKKLQNKCVLGLFQEVCKYASMKVCKYASMQVRKYASIQVCKYASMQVYKHASMQAFKYARKQQLSILVCCMQICRYASIQV